jgi:predicted  nucleic acid-binding Zn-ribbon protein
MTNNEIDGLKSVIHVLKNNINTISDALNEAMVKETKLIKVIKKKDNEIERVKRLYEELSANFAIEKNTLIISMEQGLEKLKTAFKCK